jgi:hypothetical protein
MMFVFPKGENLFMEMVPHTDPFMDSSISHRSMSEWQLMNKKRP